MTTGDAWRLRHQHAVNDPQSHMEIGIVEFMRAATNLVEGVGSAGGFPDAVGTPAFGEILSGFRTLLNFEVGRMDAGTLDSWACHVADVVRWDLDTEQIVWEKGGEL